DILRCSSDENRDGARYCSSPRTSWLHGGGSGRAFRGGSWFRTLPWPGDALGAEVLDEDVRSKQRKAAHTVVSTGVDQCDRDAVAVADENWRFHVELGEEFRESLKGFVVHVGDWARF